MATWFYSEDTINDVLNKNKVVEIREDTDTNAIEVEIAETKPIEYANEYERQILERDP